MDDRITPAMTGVPSKRRTATQVQVEGDSTLIELISSLGFDYLSGSILKELIFAAKPRKRNRLVHLKSARFFLDKAISEAEKNGAPVQPR